MFERLHGRVPVRVRVQFRSASSLLIAYSLNMSRGGMFIETAAPPEVGTTLELVVETAQTGPVTLQGRVTWRRPPEDRSGPPGIGIEFDAMSDPLGATIDQLVAAFTGVNILLFCRDARERETLKRMLLSVVTAAEVVCAEAAPLCQKLCDESIDLLVVEVDEDVEGALAVAGHARGLDSAIPVVALTADDAVAERLRAAGVSERVGNPPPLADLAHAVIRALGRPSVIAV
jgi:uncharacterized protein (TIGR02266 family)